jgi:hypothetical protein
LPPLFISRWDEQATECGEDADDVDRNVSLGPDRVKTSDKAKLGPEFRGLLRDGKKSRKIALCAAMKPRSSFQIGRVKNRRCARRRISIPPSLRIYTKFNDGVETGSAGLILGRSPHASADQFALEFS